MTIADIHRADTTHQHKNPWKVWERCFIRGSLASNQELRLREYRRYGATGLVQPWPYEESRYACCCPRLPRTVRSCRVCPGQEKARPGWPNLSGWAIAGTECAASSLDAGARAWYDKTKSEQRDTAPYNRFLNNAARAQSRGATPADEHTTSNPDRQRNRTGFPVAGSRCLAYGERCDGADTGCGHASLPEKRLL